RSPAAIPCRRCPDRSSSSRAPPSRRPSRCPSAVPPPPTNRRSAVADQTDPHVGETPEGSSPAPSRRQPAPAPAPRTEEESGRPEPGFLSQLFAPVAGFGVTFSTMFRKVATQEYPEVKRPTATRFHGRHQLNRHPDGLEKCVGCELCAWACPADAIYVE